MEVIIDGVTYKPVSEPDAEAMRLLEEVYGVLWTETYYDPYNEDTRNFARPLAEKMREANLILRFKK